MIQSLLGKLIYISNCVAPGRKFVGRILNTLRGMGNKQWTTISDDFLKDVKWFIAFAESLNKAHIFAPVPQPFFIECDSSLEAGGGFGLGKCYSWLYPEAVNLVVAYKTLCCDINQDNAEITIFTDNLSLRHALQTGRSHDPTFAACARELWLHAAINQHSITTVHKPGDQIPLADGLSRMHSNPLKAKLVNDAIIEFKLSVVPPYLDDMKCFDKLV